MYLAALIYNYDYDGLLGEEDENGDKQNELMAQLYIGAYLLLVSCISINLFIALLSEAFSSVQSDAAAITYMVEAKRLLLAERKYGLKRKHNNYLFVNCSEPLTFVSMKI